MGDIQDVTDDQFLSVKTDGDWDMTNPLKIA